MTAELERDHLGPKSAANVLNQKANLLLITCEVIVEQRQLVSRLLEHADKLKTKLNEAIDANSGTIPSPPPTAAHADHR